MAALRGLLALIFFIALLSVEFANIRKFIPYTTYPKPIKSARSRFKEFGNRLGNTGKQLRPNGLLLFGEPMNTFKCTQPNQTRPLETESQTTFNSGLASSSNCHSTDFAHLKTVTECKKKKKQDKESPETSLFNFLKLFVFRLIYGFASMIGAEGVSDFMGGILVPPSVEDGDYVDYIGVADDLDY